MTAKRLPDNRSLTALLGERLRSSMPGYGVTLAAHPAAAGSGPRPDAAVVVAIGSPHIEAVLWVEDTAGPAREWAGRNLQMRVVLWSAHQDRRIVEMVDRSIEFDPPLPDTDEILDDLIDMLDVDLRLVAEELDDDDKTALRDGLRVYRNDPILRE